MVDSLLSEHTGPLIRCGEISHWLITSWTGDVKTELLSKSFELHDRSDLLPRDKMVTTEPPDGPLDGGGESRGTLLFTVDDAMSLRKRRPMRSPEGGRGERGIPR